MGDVKPPAGGTGDSSVLLLIHGSGSGSNFSDGLSTFLRTTTISMLHQPTASTIPMEEEKAGSRVVRFFTRSSRLRRKRSGAKIARKESRMGEMINDGEFSLMTDDAQYAVCGAR